MAQSSTAPTRTPHSAVEEKNGGPARPTLLAQIPGSLYTSPGFIAGIAVAEFLYAIVLFGVMENARRHPKPVVEPQDSLVLLEPVKPSPSLSVKRDTVVNSKPSPAVTEPPKPEPSKSEPKKAEPPKPPNPPPTAPTVAQAPTPASASTPSATNLPKPETPNASPPPKVERSPSAPAPAPAPVVREEPTVGPFGPLVDPMRDCRVKSDAPGAFTLTIPASLHIYDATSKIANAPRLLVDHSGDFVAQVRVAGNLRPGTKPPSQAPLPFTFQGAGLLVWQEPDNYVRFERAAFYTKERGLIHQVLVENCKDGRTGRRVVIPIKEGAITLRAERRGSELNCTYCSDGKTWLPVKRWAPNMTPDVGVGLSASNISARGFTAQFEDFSLEKPSGHPG